MKQAFFIFLFYFAQDGTLLRERTEQYFKPYAGEAKCMEDANIMAGQRTKAIEAAPAEKKPVIVPKCLPLAVRAAHPER